MRPPDTHIQIKRIYLPADKSDGFRILIDRLWPRGLSKKLAKVDLWLKEISPSPALRKWFAHDATKFNVFREKYKSELASNPAFETLKTHIQQHKVITLLYAAKDEQNNQAVVLIELLSK